MHFKIAMLQPLERGCAAMLLVKVGQIEITFATAPKHRFQGMVSFLRPYIMPVYSAAQRTAPSVPMYSLGGLDLPPSPRQPPNAVPQARHI